MSDLPRGAEELPRLAIPDSQDREDVQVLLRRVLRLDEAAMVRIDSHGSTRSELTVWATTPFETLVCRTVSGRAVSTPLILGADHLLTELDVLPPGDARGEIDPGYSMASSWAARLPPASGFEVVDIVPAQVLCDLAARGREVARQDSGPLGLPASLLDQVALDVSGASGSASVDMRVVFAIDALRFIPQRAGATREGEPVRVSKAGSWVRVEARFGTAYRHHGAFLPLTVIA